MNSTEQSFGEIHFATAKLGDKRRTNRLITTANLMAFRPGGTLPYKLNNPKDLKALYRLMNCEQVTHQSIFDAHRSATLKQIDETQGVVLILHDGSELDFTNRASLKDDLGKIGNGSGRGYLVQNSLAVDSKSGRVLGLAEQVLHHRVDVPKNETTAQKRKRETRESLLWLKATERLPKNRKLVDVCDQGSDTFEFIQSESRSGRRFVIRACYDRSITLGHGDPAGSKSSLLRTYARTLPIEGTWELEVTSCVVTKKAKRKGQKDKKTKRIARQAKMAVSYAPVSIMPPVRQRGNYDQKPVKAWVIRVWELDPPEGQDRLEWFLITNEVVSTFAAGYRVVGWYEKRWIVEEFHKGQKTGCQIESLQFTCESRLQPAIALISVVALKLLELRDASRGADAKKRPAKEILSEVYVRVLSVWRHGTPRPDWSIHDFFYALARLGGHQNRKGDGPPGWITTWRGWSDLQAMAQAVEAIERLNKCG